MKFITYYDSPLGKITLAGDKAGFAGCGSRARNTTRMPSRQAAKTANSARAILLQKQMPLRERVATREAAR